LEIISGVSPQVESWFTCIRSFSEISKEAPVDLEIRRDIYVVEGEMTRHRDPALSLADL